MTMKRYKPKIDKLYYLIAVPTSMLLIVFTVLSALVPKMIFLMLSVDVFAAYFLLSSLFGYVELREKTLFVKYGFVLKREIPYSKIRGIEAERKWYSHSMLSLKNSLEHVNIKYNSFDVTCVSVKDNDAFIKELEERIHNGS